MAIKKNPRIACVQPGAVWNRPLAVVLTGIFVLTGSGCWPRPFSLQALSGQGASEAPAESPAELLALVREKLESAEATDQMLETTRAGHRVQMLRAHVEDGVCFADAVLTHEDVTDEQVSDALQAKLRLLEYGVQRDLFGYEEKVNELLQELKQDDAGDSTLEAAEAFSLRQRLRDAGLSTAEALAALNEHAEKYPQSEDTLGLFISYGDNLLARDEVDGAIAVYQTARAVGGDHPHSDSVTDRLKRAHTRKADLEIAQRKQLAQQRQEESYLDDIRSQIGYGREDGIFVVGAEKGRGGFLIPVEYQVCRGARQVASFAKALDKEWTWKVLGVYPNTKQGYKRALAHHGELMKKTVPMF